VRVRICTVRQPVPNRGRNSALEILPPTFPLVVLDDSRFQHEALTWLV
jgi:hypothetical protein